MLRVPLCGRSEEDEWNGRAESVQQRADKATETGGQHEDHKCEGSRTGGQHRHHSRHDGGIPGVHTDRNRRPGSVEPQVLVEHRAPCEPRHALLSTGRASAPRRRLAASCHFRRCLRVFFARPPGVFKIETTEISRGKNSSFHLQIMPCHFFFKKRRWCYTRCSSSCSSRAPSGRPRRP